MNNGSGVSRGDRNRNARLSRPCEAVPATSAIVGIDLADRQEMQVVTDHDSRGARPSHVPVQGVGPGRGVGLGRRAGHRPRGSRR